MKIAVVFIILLLGLVVSLYGKMGDGQNKEIVMTFHEYLVNSFVSELPEINKNLPHKIDNHTTLLSIEYLNGKVVSRYQLDGIGDDVDSIKSFGSEIKPILKKQNCLDEAKIKLLEAGMAFLDKYQDSSGSIIFEIMVDQSSCSGLGTKQNNRDAESA